ncbi:hypothetical protein PAPYR_10233 [Paratrimastix pyriformis]|uniref:Uncharacterized protein n=1 Tax=Paratrimastix pyriformis TaxID=342808 RepID=A0ABQ8UC77_9EUKA|nr:hypothetical protein PAPYR_10233 [Paratrimastix pyriformis]
MGDEELVIPSPPPPSSLEIRLVLSGSEFALFQLFLLDTNFVELMKSPGTVHGILKKTRSPEKTSPQKAVLWDESALESIAQSKISSPYGTMKINEPTTPFNRAQYTDSGDERSPHPMPVIPSTPPPLSLGDAATPTPATPPARSEWDSPSPSPSKGHVTLGGPDDEGVQCREGESPEEANARHRRFEAARRAHYNEFRAAQQFQSLELERHKQLLRDEVSRTHPHKRHEGSLSPARWDEPRVEASATPMSISARHGPHPRPLGHAALDSPEQLAVELGPDHHPLGLEFKAPVTPVDVPDVTLESISPKGTRCAAAAIGR